MQGVVSQLILLVSGVALRHAQHVPSPAVTAAALDAQQLERMPR